MPMRRRVALLLVLACVWPCAHTRAMPQDDEERAIDNHRLTIDLMKRTLAVDRAVAAIGAKNPDFRNKYLARELKGLEISVRSSEAIPEFAAVLKANGISARDYVLTKTATFTTALMHELITQGLMSELPPDTPPHNLEFWKAHARELELFEKEWARLDADFQKWSQPTPDR